jgi:nitrous oxidase accessory protein
MGLTTIASTLEVGVGKQYKSIKSALVSAQNGDVIVIDKGVYAEGELLVTKSVTIKGNAWPILDGKNNSQIIRIQSSGVTVEGLDLRNSGYSSTNDWGAIKVISSSNVIIRNNRLLNNAFGI